MIITVCLDFQEFYDSSVCKGGTGYNEELCRTGSIGALCQDCDIYKKFNEESYYKNWLGRCSLCKITWKTFLYLLIGIVWILILTLSASAKARQRSK